MKERDYYEEYPVEKRFVLKEDNSGKFLQQKKYHGNP
jgi:hypothetical protein